MDWKTYNSAELALRALSEKILIFSRCRNPVHISLSGGSTPKKWFMALAASNHVSGINWKNLHFWWGDERCVPPESEESNFGVAHELLLQHIEIPSENIHRIRGEEVPEKEAKRYAAEIDAWVTKNAAGTPVFDWIILGMGTDGHTASLFPQKTDFLDENFTTVAYHPKTKQPRISLTAKTLSAAKTVSYLVFGKDKSAIVEQIYRVSQGQRKELPFPAAHIRSLSGTTEWYLDQEIGNKK